MNILAIFLLLSGYAPVPVERIYEPSVVFTEFTGDNARITFYREKAFKAGACISHAEVDDTLLFALRSGETIDITVPAGKGEIAFTGRSAWRCPHMDRFILKYDVQSGQTVKYEFMVEPNGQVVPRKRP